ncbi:hypothetical protein PGT21_004944 [Puccinia graminis f. sp. tritici]|uniref:Uncharacterized protein n=1 Tax=Puccinia graminis f. sp. tritici TaxID=56615 RepID=A0A5B0PVZ7_PUCGR|nr:hypothetical protein PGTUg99_009480 [Puccinia graminis f. sp. tritici]KAA1117366.1 hypothetical protein PGT21_004944 [Puccinia graminis f. sp. tritici]
MRGAFAKTSHDNGLLMGITWTAALRGSISIRFCPIHQIKSYQTWLSPPSSRSDPPKEGGGE